MSDATAQALEHRLTSLEESNKATWKRLESHDRSFEKIDKELKDIVTLLSARPTWLITGVITILTTVTASLIVYVTTHQAVGLH